MNNASQQLWAQWAAGRLCFQRCDACRRSQHPPGPVCSHCRTLSLSLVDVSGAAELVAWSTVHRAPTKEFANQVPYTLALVRLPDGALVEARVDDDTDVDAWRVGAPTTLELGTLNGRRLPTAHVGC